ncbi:MAG TPA: TIGR00341 family protein [Terriglobales bacterium]|nr:TIGR00341 family protein [Terriglobales bacterium]
MSTAPAAAATLFKAPEVIYQEAYEGRQFDAVYFAMMVFACLIALMGLLLNSPAVIIGAMLISPLMGPILACGLALTTAEWSLGKKATRNLVLSVGEVVVIAVVATHLSPLRETTPEILARTNPNLMDLLIAFFSGLAGTVALASRKTAFTILPGVAIATAVMPPLATVGYGIGTRQWTVASGAFMLFFTNFTAIVLSASLVFLLIGFRPEVERFGERHLLLVRWRIAIAAALLLVISIPLMRTLLHASEQARIRGQVRDVLRSAIHPPAERQLDSLSVELRNGKVHVTAAVQTAQFIEPAEIERLRTAIEHRIQSPVDFQVQQLQLARRPASTEQVIHDFLAAGLVRPATIAKPPSPAAEIESAQQRLEKSLRSLVGAAGVTAQIQSVGKASDGSVEVNASAQAPQVTPVDMWMVAAAGLGKEVTAPVRMNVTVSVTGGTLVVVYHAKEVRPSSALFRRVRAFSAALPKDMSVAFVPSTGVDQALAARRVAVLHSEIPRAGVDVDLRPPVGDNALAIVPVQRIKVEPRSEAEGSSPPATPASGHD